MAARSGTPPSPAACSRASAWPAATGPSAGRPPTRRGTGGAPATISSSCAAACRARAGSIRSPLWAGGGTIFGPQPRDYAYRLPKTARRAALRAALASRHAAGTLLVVDDLSLPEPKTKQMVECLRGLGLEGASVLIVLGQADAAIQRAARNLPHVKVLVAEGLNVYDVLGHTHLVLTRAALEAVAGRLGGSA